MGNPHNCPRLRQVTSATALSNDDNSDPIYLTPGLENGASFILRGLLNSSNTVCSGTLASVVPKSVGSNQLLNASFTGSGCGTLSQGQLVYDATGNWYGFLYKLITGSTWSVSQAIVAQTVPVQNPSFNVPAEINTAANGDTFVIYQATVVDLVSIAPSVAEYVAPFNQAVNVYHLRNWPGGVSFQATLPVQGSTIFVEGSSGRVIRPGGGHSGETLTVGLVNYFMEPSATTLNGSDNNVAQDGPIVYAGVVPVENGFGYTVDQDTILPLGAVARFGHMAWIGNVYVETNAFNVSTSCYARSIAGGLPHIWGPGSMNVQLSSHFSYASGAGNAAAIFTLTGGLKINAQTKACLGIPTSASAYGTCNIPVTTSNLDANLGSTYGCLTVPGGGSICNGGLD